MGYLQFKQAFSHLDIYTMALYSVGGNLKKEMEQ